MGKFEIMRSVKRVIFWMEKVVEWWILIRV